MSQARVGNVVFPPHCENGLKTVKLDSDVAIHDIYKDNGSKENLHHQGPNSYIPIDADDALMDLEKKLGESVPVDESTLKQPLSAGEDNSEDAEEHVTSYLEKPLKITDVDDEEKSPGSRKSSSSGSYSVTSGLGLKMARSPLENLVLDTKKDLTFLPMIDSTNTVQMDQNLKTEESLDDQRDLQSEIPRTDLEPKPTPVMLRKQELTLNLHKETSCVPFKSSQELTSPEESASEDSLMWQRMNFEAGDVQKKKTVIESHEDSQPKVPNGKVRTPTSSAVRKIVNEERAVSSPLGASGLARSPAMHSGFRSEEWVVERTPVNTPVNDRVLVGMIHLSDEETSCHASSEELCKSSGATTPVGSMNSSMEPSSIDANKVLKQLIEPSTETAKMSCQYSQTVEKQPAEMISSKDKEMPQVSETEKKDQVQVPLMAPPAGFGDSPEHVTLKTLPGYHEAISDEMLPQEELLTAEDYTPKILPTMQLASEFSASSTLTCDDATIDYKVVEVDMSQSSRTHTLERISKRKSSATSVASRTSGASSTHRSRSRSRSKERLLSKLAHSGEIVITSEEDDDIAGFYIGAYDKRSWAFVGNLSGSLQSAIGANPGPLIRSESIESTQSEREFKKKYQAITHRMVHRKSSAVMYNRILERTFECNKSVKVRRVCGEFGFRIHGSRPVVVSAIEPNTPAETSGLEVGDIILTINGVNVLDLPHTEVVKTAQTGNDELELGLARVPEFGCPEDPIDVAMGRLDDSLTLIHSGYLWKLSRSVPPDGESKWSKRFFILRADSCLYFFKQEHECRPLGAILVSGCTILEGCEAEDQHHGLGRSFAFRLVFPIQSRPSCHHKPFPVDTGSPSCRVMCLAAESKDELIPWLNIIDHCAQSQEHSDDPWRVLAEERHHQPPTHFNRPDCKGFLLKLDTKTRTWKRRFCVLADACLFVYTNTESSSAIASLCLQGYRVQSTGSIGSKRHVFELIPPEQGMRFFYFMAETETEKKRWLASLEYSMDRWLKLS